MKIEINKEKLQNTLAAFLRVLPSLLVLFTIVVFAILAFWALYPREDEEIRVQGDKRIEELNIKFDTKLLDSLDTTKAPTQIGGNGGRDPFSGF